MSKPGKKALWFTALLSCHLVSLSSQAAESVLTNIQTGEMLVKEGAVNYRGAAQPEVSANPPQSLGFGDALRTLQLARATVRFADWSELRLRELTRLQIQPRRLSNIPALRLEEGQVYFANRGAIPRAIPIETPHVRGAPRGTEFLVSTTPNQTEVTMFDGEVELQGPADQQPVRVRSGEQGLTVAGQPTIVRPILQAQNIVQWWIYYPGVLDPAELGLTPAEQLQVTASLQAYQAGDLQAALQSYPGYPSPAEPQSDQQRVYLAGLFLAVGAVDRSEAILTKASGQSPLASALRIMIAAAQHRAPSTAKPPAQNHKLAASEWLAISYAHQSTNNLTAALAAARKAVDISPRFGFGWARVGELEFGFGRTRAAHEAAERAIAFSPRNAQAYTLQGFLLAAEDRYKDATQSFEQAITIDPALANAWLGRGLCRIRTGHSPEGRADLQTAAILEPNRSLIRSYAGKAFSDANDARLARKELNFARKLDPNDPTPWLYSALENWQEHRFNEAVEEIEQSIARNDNRALFRSRLLLDQDLAVRSASLARIYQNAGLEDVSLREAARAVSYDYANFSAHLFLSGSFDALRDPTRFNLRYETPWFNELLLANLLSPVGGTPLSQNISQQEYARLFDQDRIGIFNSSEYRSDGQFRELASQFGTLHKTAWSLDLDYQHNEGVRVNNELDRIEWYSTIKQELSAQDTILFLTKYQDYHSGDNFQYYYPTNARPNFRFDEEQKPLALAGYHHEWQPGVHTLLLGGRLENDQRFSDTSVLKPILITNSQGTASAVLSQPFDERYQSRLEIYTAELSQIYQQERHGVVFGGRFQSGRFHTSDQLTSSLNPGDAAFYPPVSANQKDAFERVTGYGYYTIEAIEHLLLTAGIAYDRIELPINFRHAPLTPGTEERDRVSPKAALVWSVAPALTLRGMFSRGLGGVSLDESFRLEPTQLAGFSQSFRSVIPEPIVGSVSAPANQIAGAAADLKLGTHTYAGVQASAIESKVHQTIGAFNFNADVPPSSPASPTGTLERFNYDEQSLQLSVQQLVSAEWSFGAASQLTRSVLNTYHPELPSSLPESHQFESAKLIEVALFALYNHPSGWFGRAEGHWYRQKNSSFPTSDFYQAHLFLGWRFPRRHGEVAFGILNLNDTDYHLNPLNLHPELPRERTYVGRVTFTF